MKTIRAKTRQEEYDLRAKSGKDPNILTGRNKAKVEFSINRICELLPFKREDVVLDIGPGDGLLFKKINKNVKQCYGVDPSINAINWLKDLFKSDSNVDFNEGYSKKLPFPDGMFSKVVMNAVLQLLPDDQEVRATLKEIRRVSNRDAVIFIGDCPSLSVYDSNNLKKQERSLFFKLKRKYRNEGVLGLANSLNNRIKGVINSKFGHGEEDECIFVGPKHHLYYEPDGMLKMCSEFGLKGKYIISEDEYGEVSTRYDYLLYPV